MDVWSDFKSVWVLFILDIIFMYIGKGIQDYDGYSAIFNDSIQDLNANIRGLYTGYNNKDGNCYNLIKPYYKP